MKKNDFTSLIGSNDFRQLFISHLGWNRWRGNSRLLPIIIDDKEYQFNTIAERSGLQVVVVEADELPKSSLMRKIDNQLRRQAQDYISIYVLKNDPKHHLWVVPLKNIDKRDLVSLEYADASHADFLFSKIDALEFSPGETTTIVDVKEAVHKAFYVNSERITKDFYAGFKKQHAAFAKFITGIDDDIAAKDNRNKQWYASVMLNRLMFCYFIQKKGFLDGNYNYLRDKLDKCIAERGKDQFYATFYKRFLRRLFSDGLNSPKHEHEFMRQFGRIPYLNGGMFDCHKLECEYEHIDIEDGAFVSLFEFFDKWQWHLDTRVTASGKDINPDVLGYIFEQYINDRAQMGAYYTKEDITEYIGRNTILPFLFDRLARSSKAVEAMFAPNGWVWQTLRVSGDRYLFDAVKQGWSPDWRELIPADIAIGLDTQAPNLLERRARWNDRTPEPFALPTEIWRETIERLQRVDAIMAKIQGGEITSVNDFITYNLDIRLFASDLIAKSDSGSFVYNFYEALRSITVLDPTCGSGAFLFAAMNILEPLYYECILRLDEFRDNPKVRMALDEISSKYRSNIHYFIYKSIILRNLYGVDIMVEATEIAKLRLFLKMVAVVDVDYNADNLGLDPLPDIDFNIRCGNTLVGYANEKSIWADHQADMFARLEFEDKIKGEMDIVARTYDIFKRAQLTQEDNIEQFKQAKRDLNDRLAKLNDILNRHLHSATASGIPYDKWLASHQPFHWVAEFYQIIHGNNGFDVIIGNPPYVEFPSSDVQYKFENLLSKDCGNLYGCCIERGFQIGKKSGKLSYIIPVAITCSKRMKNVIDIMKTNSKVLYFSNYDDRPGKLFEMIEHLRASIFISVKGENLSSIYSTKYNRWYTSNRSILFELTQYVNVIQFCTDFTIPKFSKIIECNINSHLLSIPSKIASLEGLNLKNAIYYRAAGGGYFLLIKPQKSITYIDGKLEDVKAEKIIFLNEKVSSENITALLSSSLFYWHYIAYTDCRNLTKGTITSFPCPKSLCTNITLSKISKLLYEDYEKNSICKDTYYKKTNRNVIYWEYHQGLSKRLIDKVDINVSSHFNLTEEQLDFIINYDIKYRMGDELNNESDE